MIQSLFVLRLKSTRLLSVITVAVLNASTSASHAQTPKDATPDPVAAEFQNVSLPQNLPSAEIAALYPKSWTTYSANAGRNAVFDLPDSAPQNLRDGVRWSFAGAGAIPLEGKPLTENFKTTAYTIGMPVGVSVVGGMVYVGDDNGYTYALNAITGQLVWAHYGWNMTMSNPLVEGDKVFVSTGNAYFNYANTMKYIQHQRPVRGPGLNTIYALDRKTGKELWSFHPLGEAMPTPLVDGKHLYAGTGDGHIYKLDAETGAQVWKTDVLSFISMSSPVLGDDRVFLGGTNPNFFYAIDKESGQISWKADIPNLVATGLGDCTPAYSDGRVVTEVTVDSGDKDNPVANVLLAFDAKTGGILWQKRFDNGPTPGAMKTATPMIAEGVVYEGSPVSGDYYAIDLKTGDEKWKLHLGGEIRAGAAVRGGVAFLPYRTGDIAAIRLRDGKLLKKTHIGGAFGPSSPVIVGGTLHVSNVYGWVTAVPLTDLKGEENAN